MSLDDRSKLTPPFPVGNCENPDCGTWLDRSAYLLLDTYERVPVIFCDDCARCAVKDSRFRPIVDP